MNLIFIFLIFSFLGFLIENLLFSKNGKLHCNPILQKLTTPCLPFLFCYGMGGLIISFSYTYISSWTWYTRALFYGITFSIFEYLASFISEKVICPYFKTCRKGNKGWDYSHLPFNIHGRVSLIHTVGWMILGLLGERFYLYLINI